MLVVINIDSLMRRRLCGKLHGGPSHCCSHSSSHRSDSQIWYWPWIAIFAYHTCIRPTPPLRGSPWEYCHNVWFWKTRIMWLPDSENILKICLFVFWHFWHFCTGMDSSACGRVHVGTGMDLHARTARWPTAIVAGRPTQASQWGRDRHQYGHRDR